MFDLVRLFWLWPLLWTLNVEIKKKKSKASPTVTVQESKEDVEFQRQQEQDERPAQPLLEIWNFHSSLPLPMTLDRLILN